MTAGLVEHSSSENSTDNTPIVPTIFYSEMFPHLIEPKREKRPSSLFRFQLSSHSKSGKSNSTKSSPSAPTNSSEFEKPLTFVDSEIESMDGEDTEEDAIDKLAKELFLQTEEMKISEVAEILGKPGKWSQDLLRKYMGHFNFTGMRLEQAFRFFCSHLFLHGESQMIDRILSAFAERYWTCNRDRNIPDWDVLYTIVYSVLLLNTDLHVAQNNHKISKNEFVKNTLATIKASSRRCQPNEDNESASEVSSLNSSHAYSDTEQASMYSSSGRSSFREESISELLKEMYSSIKHTQIPQPNSKLNSYSPVTSSFGAFKFQRSKSSASSKLSRSKKRNDSLCSDPLSINEDTSCRSSTQLSRSTTYSDIEGSLVDDTEDIPKRNGVTLSTVDEENVKYTKLGHVTRKHLFERAGKKASNRQWRDCFAVVDKGEFRMYKAGKSGKLGAEVLDEGSSQLGRVSLRHTLTSGLPPPGHSSSRPYVFALQLSHGGVYLFQVRSSEEVHEWVRICNFWAAKESKEPLPGAVSNLDYGWGSDQSVWAQGIKDADSTKESASVGSKFEDHIGLHDWTEPSNPMVQSGLNKTQQYNSLARHVSELEYELEKHMSFHSVLQIRFSPNSSNMAKAFSSWERKSQYILHELIKYQTYVDCLRSEVPSNVEVDSNGGSFMCTPSVNPLNSKEVIEKQCEFRKTSQKPSGQNITCSESNPLEKVLKFSRDHNINETSSLSNAPVYSTTFPQNEVKRGILSDKQKASLMGDTALMKEPRKDIGNLDNAVFA
ncbi:hypothetical protein K7432_004940 [Basidiobolus ranarum]|uniref:Uncharacterized protein n=1 Tax=Basidiobolus ranarum TaxID=34480 RepID=A0ABR2WXG5_9FUNG